MGDVYEIAAACAYKVYLGTMQSTDLVEFKTDWDVKWVLLP